MSHKLRINNRQVSLDGFVLKGVEEYEVKSSGKEHKAELTLKLIVEDSELVLDKGANNVNSDFC